MFTAGGTSTVRGWGSGQLGPRIPDVEVIGATVNADRYLPIGGLARVTGSVEAVLPLPLLSSSHRSFVFLDVGRVWTPGGGLVPGDPELALEPWGFGTGAGLQFGTPFGPLRLSVGYKLNPTRIDLLAPGDVARALAAGDDLARLSTDGFRRWHLHVTVGQGL
jgi:outer membrane protein assembly factor BamA